MNLTKKCSKCGISKPLDEFHNQKDGKYGKRADCKKCNIEHSKQYAQEHKVEIKKYQKNYRQNNKEKIRTQRGSKSMYEDKSSNQWLGIVIGERLCRHLFKDVEVMPFGNPKFDIVCNRGKKIDVKIAVITFNHGKNPRWIFNIRRNTTADFFICVAFDNRIDLNPLHLWMIPGKEVNHKTKEIISPSRIHKWDKWERDINNAQLCCTEMKKEK